MQLARLTPADTIPWPPMKTAPDALVGIERGIAAAGAAAHDPSSSEPAHLRTIANVVREAAAIIERSIGAPLEQSLPTAVQHARAGADLLDSTALLIETAGDDETRWEQAAKTADVAFDTLVAAFTLAGGS